MVRKGNLLYNGTFETGDTTDWVTKPHSLGNNFTIEASTEKVYKGSYSGKVTITDNGGNCFLEYDKALDFEDYEAYLMLARIYLVDFSYGWGAIYVLDDNENYSTYNLIGKTNELNKWKTLEAIIIGQGDCCKFKPGAIFYGVASNNYGYIDELKVMPLKSRKANTLFDSWEYTALNSDATKYLLMAVTAPAKIFSKVRVSKVSGTNPTLDISVKSHYFEDHLSYESVSHTQFTATGQELKTLETPGFCWIEIGYTLGGTDPSFDLVHTMRVSVE